MARTLYDLAGAEDNRRFSPYCWRVKMALAHKGLAFDTIPWRFTEKEAIAFSQQSLVPVLVDGERVVTDSWAILQYLDAAYPETAPLAEGAQAWGYARFIKHWTERSLQGALMRIIVPDILAHVHPKDRDLLSQLARGAFRRHHRSLLRRPPRPPGAAQESAGPAPRDIVGAALPGRRPRLGRLPCLRCVPVGALHLAGAALEGG